MAKKKYIEWDKCVHIHACRRLCAIIRRETGRNIVRGCGKECSAYSECNNELIKEELDSIIDNAENADDEIRSGCEDNDSSSYARSLIDIIKRSAERIKDFTD